VVEGRVEASMDSRAIQISEHGVFVGKAGIDVAEIRGRFEGELTARKQLVIRANGRVSGKVVMGKSRSRKAARSPGDIAALPRPKARRRARCGRSHAAAPAVPAGQAACSPAGQPAWTAQTGTQPQPGKTGGSAQAGTQPQPSKPAAAPQAGAQPQPSKPAGASH